MNTLEILRIAEASITGKVFEFSNWNQCTCGHIYRAASGIDTATETEVLNNLDHPVLREVASALGWLKDESAGDFISYATMKSVKGHDPTFKDGLDIVQTAIANIEAQQERDRLDVLAQMKKVIDNAVVEEAVTV